jgi:thymidylate kinase
MGVYICLEGVKGSGKTTLLHGLKIAFDQQDVDWAVVSPTRRVNGLSLMEWVAARMPVSRQLDWFNEYLYAYRSNYAAQHTNWNTALLIGDRSIITSYITRWHRHSDPEQCIQRVNRLEWAIHPPDHVIYLQTDADTALARIHGRAGRTYGKQDETRQRIEQNVEAYNAIMLGTHPIPRLSHTCWHVIDAGQSRDTVLDECIQLIQTIAPELFQWRTIALSV